MADSHTVKKFRAMRRMEILGLALLLSATASAATVTVPLIIEGNAPIVNVSVKNGSAMRTARFLVDTGGGAIILGSKVMADLGIKPAGPEFSEEGQRMVPVTGLTLDIGGLHLKLQDVRIFGLTASVRMPQRNSTEGLLPDGVLRNYRVSFDYPGRRFTLATESVGKGLGSALLTPVATPSGFPRLEVEVAGQHYGFLLDTGASFTMVSQRIMTSWKAEHPQWPAAVGAVGFPNMFGGAGDNHNVLLRSDKVKLGPFWLPGVAMVSRRDGTFEDSMTRRMSAPIIGSIGDNVLRDFRVEIDYLHGITYLQKNRSSHDTDLTGVGLIVQWADDAPVITGIGSTAAAETKNLVQPNDLLLPIDGRKVDGEPLAVLAQMLSGTPDSHKRLTLRRKGELVEVEVPVTKLL
jgi:hypothetical protein